MANSKFDGCTRSTKKCRLNIFGQNFQLITGKGTNISIDASDPEDIGIDLSHENKCEERKIEPGASDSFELRDSQVKVSATVEEGFDLGDVRYSKLRKEDILPEGDQTTRSNDSWTSVFRPSNESNLLKVKELLEKLISVLQMTGLHDLEVKVSFCCAGDETKLAAIKNNPARQSESMSCFISKNLKLPEKRDNESMDDLTRRFEDIEHNRSEFYENSSMMKNSISDIEKTNVLTSPVLVDMSSLEMINSPEVQSLTPFEMQVSSLEQRAFDSYRDVSREIGTLEKQGLERQDNQMLTKPSSHRFEPSDIALSSMNLQTNEANKVDSSIPVGKRISSKEQVATRFEDQSPTSGSGSVKRTALKHQDMASLIVDRQPSINLEKIGSSKEVNDSDILTEASDQNVSSLSVIPIQSEMVQDADLRTELERKHQSMGEGFTSQISPRQLTSDGTVALIEDMNTPNSTTTDPKCSTLDSPQAHCLSALKGDSTLGFDNGSNEDVNDNDLRTQQCNDGHCNKVTSGDKELPAPNRVSRIREFDHENDSGFADSQISLSSASATKQRHLKQEDGSEHTSVFAVINLREMRFEKELAAALGDFGMTLLNSVIDEPLSYWLQGDLLFLYVKRFDCPDKTSPDGKQCRIRNPKPADLQCYDHLKSCTVCIGSLLDHKEDSRKAVNSKTEIIHAMAVKGSRIANKTISGVLQHFLPGMDQYKKDTLLDTSAHRKTHETEVHDVIRELKANGVTIGQLVIYFLQEENRRLDIVKPLYHLHQTCAVCCAKPKNNDDIT